MKALVKLSTLIGLGLYVEDSSRVKIGWAGLWAGRWLEKNLETLYGPDQFDPYSQ